MNDKSSPQRRETPPGPSGDHPTLTFFSPNTLQRSYAETSSRPYYSQPSTSTASSSTSYSDAGTNTTNDNIFDINTPQFQDFMRLVRLFPQLPYAAIQNALRACNYNFVRTIDSILHSLNYRAYLDSKARGFPTCPNSARPYKSWLYNNLQQQPCCTPYQHLYSPPGMHLTPTGQTFYSPQETSTSQVRSSPQISPNQRVIIRKGGSKRASETEVTEQENRK